MNIVELREYIQEILESKGRCGLKVYACISVDSNIILKKFVITDELKNRLIEQLTVIIKEAYLNDEMRIEDIDCLSSDKNVLYDIVTNNEYNPFSFIDGYSTVSEQYDGGDKNEIMGFAYRFNINKNSFWGFQQIYSMNLFSKRKYNTLAILSKNKVYDLLKQEIISLGSKIDALYLYGHVITSNIKLLQEKFKFDGFIRKEANQTVDKIIELDIVSNVDKLVLYSNKENIRYAKKLMKANKSPVLSMKKGILIDRLRKHNRYSSMLEIKEDKIVTETVKDIEAFVKMLNDDILRSDITYAEYDSITKNRLSSL